MQSTSVLSKLVTLVGLLASGSGIMLAQGPRAVARVRGTVQDAQGAPVREALVEILDRGMSTRSSATGAFRFDSVPVGDAVLRLRALGFEPREVAIRVLSDRGWSGTLTMQQATRTLPEVQVVAKPPEFANTSKYDDFFRRRARGFGTFRTRDDIVKLGAHDIVAALQQIPGVTVSATGNPNGEPEVRFRMARCPGNPPNLAIYINGDRVAAFGKNENRGSELSGLFRGTPPSSTCPDCVRIGEILSSVPVSEVLFMEFYRGSGQIPNDLDRGDVCAALVIWTR